MRPREVAREIGTTSLRRRRLSILIDAVLPDRACDPQERQAVGYLCLCCGIAALAALVALPIASAGQLPPLLAFTAGTLAVPLLLRANVAIAIVQKLLLSLTAVFLVSMCLVNPTFVAQQIYWFAILPLGGGLVLDRSSGLLIGCALAAAGAGIVLYVFAGQVDAQSGAGGPLAYLALDAATFIVSIAGLTGLYVRLHTRAVRRAEHAAYARGEFLAQMSHELRTPMNGVLGMLQLHDETADAEVRRAQLALMRRSGEAMVAIIDDLLDFSRLEAGELRIARLPFDPRQVVQDAADLYRPRAAEKGLVLTLEIAPAVPQCLAGDALRLGQVLRNLVSNAIKFTQRGAVRVRLDWAESVLTGTVVDEGIGIASTAIDTLFSPFHQASTDTANRFGGSGLGLAISRSLCRRMGGDVSVVSQPGAGSCFTFTCVAAETPMGVREDESPVAQIALSGRVLIVDDNDLNRLIAQRFCERAGLVVSLACDGEEALASVTGQSFDLVLMDCQMPVMNGFEATRRIRAIGGVKGAVPIVALTASTLPGELRHCRDVGMNDVVAKPLNGGTLLAVIERNMVEARVR